MIWFGLVLWHINYCRLFNAKSCLYVYVKIHFKIGRSTKRFVFFEFILFLHTCYVYVCFQLVAFVREHMWHKALLMGYSMRLELTLVSSLNDFQYVWAGFIWRLFSLFPRVHLLWSTLPRFDI